MSLIIFTLDATGFLQQSVKMKHVCMTTMSYVWYLGQSLRSTRHAQLKINQLRACEGMVLSFRRNISEGLSYNQQQATTAELPCNSNPRGSTEPSRGVREVLKRDITNDKTWEMEKKLN